MDRRAFLRSLLGASAFAAAPAPVIYVMAPSGGWRRAVATYTFRDVNAYTAHYGMMCTEGNLIAALRKIDPLVACSIDYKQHALHIASGAGIADIKRALWWHAPIGLAITLNGLWLPNNHGYESKEEA